MTPFQHHIDRSPWPCALTAVALTTALFCASAVAAPGAHGPNGEHLDGPTSSAATGRNSSPRLETKSELFELVASLSADEYSMLIHRFQTNEPVLRADVEVETGGVKAKAKFHDDHGDYAVDDAGFLKALSSPGQHALVITVRAGNDADLLDGTLTVGPQALAVHDHAGAAHDPAGGHGHDDDHGPAQGLSRSGWAGWAGLAMLVLVAAAALVWWRRRQPLPGHPLVAETKPGSNA